MENDVKYTGPEEKLFPRFAEPGVSVQGVSHLYACLFFLPYNWPDPHLGGHSRIPCRTPSISLNKQLFTTLRFKGMCAGSKIC